MGGRPTIGKSIVFCLFFWGRLGWGTAISLDVGAFADNLAERVSAPAGFNTQVSTLSGIARLRPIFSLGPGCTFEPSYALVLPWRSGSDGTAKVLTSVAGLDFGFSPWHWLKWRVGPGVESNWIFTQASAVELNNGTGTTTFYLPGGTSSSWELLVETGIELSFFQSISLGMEIWVAQALGASRRRFNGAIYLGVRL